MSAGGFRLRPCPSKLAFVSFVNLLRCTHRRSGINPLLPARLPFSSSSLTRRTASPKSNSENVAWGSRFLNQRALRSQNTAKFVPSGFSPGFTGHAMKLKPATRMMCCFAMRPHKIRHHADGVVSSKAISRALVGVYSNHLPISDASAELAISAFSSSPDRGTSREGR